jgi:hypothetical protein
VLKTISREFDLAQTPLPEVLAILARDRKTGVLTIQGKSAVTKIHIQDDRIIFADSTDPTARLGDFLLRRGKITRAQHEESVRLMKAGGNRQGTVLVGMGVLTPKTLFEAVQEQIQAILYSAFLEEDGVARFESGNAKGDEILKLSIPIARAVLEGVKRIPDAKKLAARLGARTAVYSASGKPGDAEAAGLSAEEMALLKRVNGRTSLFDLITREPGTQIGNARLLYAFSVLNLITRKAPGLIKIQWKTKGDDSWD